MATPPLSASFKPFAVFEKLQNYLPSISTVLQVIAIATGIFLILGILALSSPLIGIITVLIVAASTGAVVSQSKKIVEVVPIILNYANETPIKRKKTAVKYYSPKYIEIVVPKQTTPITRTERAFSDPGIRGSSFHSIPLEISG